MRKNTVITVKSLSQHQDLIIEPSMLNGGHRRLLPRQERAIAALNQQEVQIQRIG
jgi:hypothetical protein